MTRLFFSVFYNSLDPILNRCVLLPCLYLPNQMSPFCFPSQLLFTLPEESRWWRLRLTLVYSHISAQTHTHTHTSSWLFTITSFLLLHYENKKPQTTTFLIKFFLGAFFCLSTPSLKEPLVDFFWRFFYFQGARKHRSLPKALRMSFFLICWPWWSSINVFTSLLTGCVFKLTSITLLIPLVDPFWDIWLLRQYLCRCYPCKVICSSI